MGNDFYAHFLDDELLYSSALFTDDGTGSHPGPAGQNGAPLRASGAYARRSSPGDWHRLGGDGTEYAARHYGCRVTTTTLSQEQFQWANARIARAGLQDRVEVLLCDYRDLTGTSTTSCCRWR
ncbi:class I SAM-dependent methyltransferase [Klebsiella michiganensis]|nr:class I SAM-dependent methyltransferase [Klebsiella michiganensis]